MRAWLLLLLIPFASADVQHFEHTTADDVTLDALISTPNGTGPWPAVIVGHGWGGNKADGTAAHTTQWLNDAGFLVAAWSQRGFGQSGGESNLMGPKEISDAREFIDLLSLDDRVIQEAPGDPLLAMVGQSYGGALAQLVSIQDGRVDAIIPVTTWRNLAAALAPHDVPKLGWISLLYASGMQNGHGIGTDPTTFNSGGMMADIHEWYAYALATNKMSPEAYTALDGVRSVHAGELDIPTMLVQGWPDTLFPVSPALETFQDLTNRDVASQLVIAPIGHGGFYADDRGDWNLDFQVELEAMMVNFLNLHLLQNGTTPYPVQRYHMQDQAFLPELQWPPAGTTVTRFFMDADNLAPAPPAANVTTTLLMGQALTCTDVPNFQTTLTQCPYDAPGDSHTWTTAPFATDTEITGQATLFIEYASTSQTGARLFFTLMDVDADGNANPIMRQTTAFFEPFPGDVQVKLEAVSHTLKAGHRLGIQIATSNTFMASTREPGAVTITSYAVKPGMLDVPIVTPNAYGDREVPVATIAPFIPCNNCTGLPGHKYNVTATDDWHVSATVLVNGTAQNMTWSSIPGGIQATLFLPLQPADQVVQLIAVDPTGKNATATVTAPAYVAPQPVQESAAKSTPGFTVVAGLLAMALVWKRTSKRQ